jgi:hypothetical protein
MTWRSRAWGAAGGATPTPTLNPFAHLADTFVGGEPAPSDRGWDYYKPAAIDEAVVTTGLDLEPVRGGVDLTGSLWFTANAGAQYTGHLVFRLLGPTAPTATPTAFDARARLVATNSAQDDDPPVAGGEYRYVVLAVHDPDRATDLNYVHIGIGADPDGLQIEVKTTDSDGVTAQSVYPVVAASGTGTGLAYDVRIVRRATDTDVFDCYYRPTGAAPLTSNTGWILHTVVDRGSVSTPARASAVRLPDDVQIGFAVYASAATHDIHGRVLGFVVLPTED